MNAILLFAIALISQSYPPMVPGLSLPPSTPDIIWAADIVPDRPTAPIEVEEEKPLTYSKAYRKAIDEDKPLLVWVGGNFCERCVEASAEEFVHYFTDSFQNKPNPSIVVIMKEEEKPGSRLVIGATVTDWIEGSDTHGHIPSVRAAMREFRGRRMGRRESAYSGTMMMSAYASSGCSSGACSMKRGLFRRRQ